MKTDQLKGAWLDYWVAVSEGVPHSQLQIRPVPRTDLFVCVYSAHSDGNHRIVPARAMNYSSDWAMTGPLMDKYMVIPEYGGENGKVMASVFDGTQCQWTGAEGATAREAICRAVVMLHMGEEVTDVEVTSEN